VAVVAVVAVVVGYVLEKCVLLVVVENLVKNYGRVCLFC